MVFWHAPQQRTHNFVLLVLIRPYRRGQPVRYQRLKATIFLPRWKPAGVLQDLEQKRFVVTLEEDALMSTAAFDQQVDRLPRRGATIDIIAQEHMEGPDRSGAR